MTTVYTNFTCTIRRQKKKYIYILKEKKYQNNYVINYAELLNFFIVLRSFTILKYC